MTTKTIQLDDFEKELGNIAKDRLDDYKNAVISGVVGSIPMLVEQSPVDTGLYASSWDFEVSEKSVILGN